MDGATEAPKASSLIKSGLFDNLTSFLELEQRIGRLATAQDRGDALEVFVEAYIATQSTLMGKRIWPGQSLPPDFAKKLGLDFGGDWGIDGAYETTVGKLRVYQVKYRTSRPALTWRELSTFTGLADRADQIDITTVKTHLGHKTLTMTLRYSHLAPSHTRNALSVLDEALTGSQLYNYLIVEQKRTQPIRLSP